MSTESEPGTADLPAFIRVGDDVEIFFQGNASDSPDARMDIDTFRILGGAAFNGAHCVVRTTRGKIAGIIPQESPLDSKWEATKKDLRSQIAQPLSPHPRKLNS